MFLLRNGLLQNSAFLRHHRCIELGKRYIKALALSNSRQFLFGIIILDKGQYREMIFSAAIKCLPIMLISKTFSFGTI